MSALTQVGTATDPTTLLNTVLVTNTSSESTTSKKTTKQSAKISKQEQKEIQTATYWTKKSLPSIESATQDGLTKIDRQIIKINDKIKKTHDKVKEECEKALVAASTYRNQYAALIETKKKALLAAEQQQSVQRQEPSLPKEQTPQERVKSAIQTLANLYPEIKKKYDNRSKEDPKELFTFCNETELALKSITAVMEALSQKNFTILSITEKDFNEMAKEYKGTITTDWSNAQYNWSNAQYYLNKVIEHEIHYHLNTPEQRAVFISAAELNDPYLTSAKHSDIECCIQGIQNEANRVATLGQTIQLVRKTYIPASGTTANWAVCEKTIASLFSLGGYKFDPNDFVTSEFIKIAPFSDLQETGYPNLKKLLETSAALNTYRFALVENLSQPFEGPKCLKHVIDERRKETTKKLEEAHQKLEASWNYIPERFTWGTAKLLQSVITYGTLHELIHFFMMVSEKNKALHKEGSMLSTQPSSISLYADWEPKLKHLKVINPLSQQYKLEGDANTIVDDIIKTVRKSQTL